MKINCLSCGHKVDLDDVYDDYEGCIKCLCGAMLEIRTEEGRLKAVTISPLSMPPPKPRSAPGPPPFEATAGPAGAGNFEQK